MNLNKPAVIKKLQERFRNVNAGRGLYTAFLVPTMLTMFSTRAFAADTIWTKASAIMQDVYTQILGISTIAAVVTAAIALLLMNFSRSGRTVDESRAWLKRIIITWAILNMLTCTSVDFDETVTDATAMSALAACKDKYNGVARKGVEAIEMKLKGYEATEIAKHYDTSVNNVNAWISRARSKLRNEPALLEILY